MKKITEDIDLKEIEKKAWSTRFVDGILDTYFGFLFLGMTIAMIFDDILPGLLSTLLGLTIITTGVIFFVVGKKYISEPRIGKVKFGRIRKVRKAKTIGILTINFFILLIIFIIGDLNPDFKIVLPGYLYGLIMGFLFMGLPLCFVAYLIEFKRFYIIAVLVGFSFFFEEVLALANVPEPFDRVFSFGIISTIIILMGLIVFIRFLKNYPLPKEEIN